MDEKRNFYVARIEEDKKGEKKTDNNFVSPYHGRNNKNVMNPPIANNGNGTKQYESLKSKEDRKPEEAKDKYSLDRIPSYLRGDQPAITRKNIDDLQGKKLTDEERYEMYRRNYGQYNAEGLIDKAEPEAKEVEYAETKFETSESFDQIDDLPQVSNEDEFVRFTAPVEEPKPVRPIRQEPKIVSKPSYANETSFDKPVESFEQKPVEPTPEIRRPVLETKQPVKQPAQPAPKRKKYKFPPLDVLRRGGKGATDSQAETNHQISIINTTLEQFRIGGHVVKYTKGPTVTQYEVKLDPGVLVSKVEGIGKNLQMNLAVDSIRIEAPIPGKPSVGIEVPNVKKDSVLFGDMLCNKEFLNDGKPLNVILGLKLDGTPQYLNIVEMPHAIVAGSTNSGKTVCIHSIINSILYKATPDEVRLVLVDPKSNEFMFYEDIPHLAAPIIDDPKYAASTMKWAIGEMKRRFDILKQARKNKISDYNEAVDRTGEGVKLPYIVIIIDEFADLMNMASDTFETNVQRITQKARSVGIHMIIATQRPSVDVIKGTIKANIQTRIALKVNTNIDSQTILDHGGAEKLLGRGDALYTKGGPDTRIQCAYISTDEIEEVTGFLRDECSNSFMFTLDELEEDTEVSTSEGSSPLADPLFVKVAKFVVTYKNASMNQIQKHFNIGYNRADEIMDGLQSLGIVSPVVHGKQRSVMIELDQLDDLLKNKG